MVKKKFWQERGNGQFLGGGKMTMVSMTPRSGLSGFYVLPMGREEYRP
jgi:hypothetical protein